MTQVTAIATTFAPIDNIKTLSQIVGKALLAGFRWDRTCDIIQKVVLKRSMLTFSEPLQSYAEAFRRWHKAQHDPASVSAEEDIPRLWLLFTPEMSAGYLRFEVTYGHTAPAGMEVPLENLLQKVQSPYGGNQLLDDYYDSLENVKKTHPEIVDTEMALLSLLVYERDNANVGLFDFTQPGADEIFHKAFRQSI